MNIFLSLLYFITLTLSVDSKVIKPQKLYTKAPSSDNGLTGQDLSHNSINHVMSGISDPDFFLFLPDPAITTGKAVIICPGGAYNGVVYGHEGLEPAKWLNDLGIAAIVLRYRMPNRNYKIPLDDVHQMFRIVRKNASRWGINPHDVGIMGFSAGGHLASTAATKFTEDTRPNFAILLYPVITMDSTLTHVGSRNNLIGPEKNINLERLYSNELHITAQSPKSFIALSDDDRVVVSQNSTLYYNALKKENIPAELHIYPSGGHGWGWQEKFKHRDEFLNSLERWLKSN